MSVYNWFGQTAEDMVRSFNGADFTDFDPASVKTSGGGADYIEDQMDLVESEILNNLSPKAVMMIERIEYMKLPVLAASATFTLPFPLLVNLEMWAVEKESKQCDSQYTLSTGCSTRKCANIKNELCDNNLFTDFTEVDDVLTFGLTFNQATYDYYMSYDIDSAYTNLPSLGKILRDRVACLLGMQLYSRQDDTWKLVDMYCESGDKGLGAIDEHYIPSEYRRFKWLNSPFSVRGGFTSIRIGRS